MVKIHLVQAGDTFDSIQKLYGVSERDLLRLNPIIRNKYLYIGQVLYIVVDDEKILIKKDDKYYCILEKIHFLLRADLVSYINNFNDHSLIEENLFNHFTQLTKKAFPESNNDQEILSSYLESIHKNFHDFSDALIQKQEERIKDIKSNINNTIEAMSNFFKNKNSSLNIEYINNLVNNNLLMIAKIINKNYFEAWKLMEDNISKQ